MQDMRDEDGTFAEVNKLGQENAQLKERINDLSMHIRVLNDKNSKSDVNTYDTHERDMTIIMGDKLQEMQAGDTGGLGLYPQLQNIDSHETDSKANSSNSKGKQSNNNSMMFESNERKSTRIDYEKENIAGQQQQQQQREQQREQMIRMLRQRQSRQSLSAIVIPSPKGTPNLNQAIDNAIAHTAAFHKIEQTPAESDVLTR